MIVSTRMDQLFQRGDCYPRTIEDEEKAELVRIKKRFYPKEVCTVERTVCKES